MKADKTQTSRSKARRSTARRTNPKPQTAVEVVDYRHRKEKRKNNPDAGLASYNYKPQAGVKYSYDPHLDPQLTWAGKVEQTSFDVETVSLHIHERVSTKAILKSVQFAQQWRQKELFAEPELPLDKRIEFYQHEMDWANRLILGDSLHVMNSLLERELMAGKVQMIYMDPPYGIKYASNFQPRMAKREVKDTDEDLTREPEQIKAYRDTWQLGIHSWLAYLRDRLLLCRDLLHENGSIFVQINDENLHLVRSLLDEVFKRENFVAVISYKKASPESKTIRNTVNYLVWYAKDASRVKCRRLFRPRTIQEGTTEDPKKLALCLELADGTRRTLTTEEKRNPSSVPTEARIYRVDKLANIGESENTYEFEFDGKSFHPGVGHCWKADPEGLHRLSVADRITITRTGLGYKFYLVEDYPLVEVTNLWDDTAGKVVDMTYAVQTNHKVIERCILMSTDPGDLVFDPTCGSGTTAYCAERWGRRWITCDTSRVALALARQRLLTARFGCYVLADQERGPAAGFIYETAPHITLESIASNTQIDVSAMKYSSQIDAALEKLNKSLNKAWKEWEVPHEAGDSWSAQARQAHELFWELKRKRREEIDESIKRNAKQELLYDRVKIEHNAVRVSGPFTVEAIPMPAMQESPESTYATGSLIDVATDHLNVMIELLQKSGITFPDSKRMTLENLRPVSSAGFLHAEGEANQNGTKVGVAVSFGPRHGPVTAKQVDEAIRSSYKLGYDILVLAGFAFDPEAQATIQKNPLPKLKVHLSHISPDVIVGDLLKTTKGSQLFTVFGQPDIKLERSADGFTLKLLGVDIYNPETGEVHSSNANEIAAWFLDEDYDGYTFRICQAFFPKEATVKNPWDRLENALRGVVDKEKLEMFRGTESLQFKAGQEKHIAVKVIDNRGNEVMVVKSLEDGKG